MDNPIDDEAKVRNKQSGMVHGPVAQIGYVHGNVHLSGQTPNRLVPKQLRQSVGHFTGRVDELAALTAMLNESARPVVISAVEGTTGIGKTALVVHWAAQVADRFPDGQLYVDLQGSDSFGRLNPIDVLRGFLKALGEEQIPQGAEAEHYRTLLADKRMLVVLDNARDVEQVRPLLPGGSTSLAVVTSRHQLPGLVAQGARSLTLDVLVTSDARELLASHLGFDRVTGEPQAVDELIELCAGMPEALAIVAAHATDIPLAVLVTELRNEAGLSEAGNLAARVRAVRTWSNKRTGSPPPVGMDRLSKLAWARDVRVLFATAVAVSTTTLVVSTGMIAASSFLGIGYFAIRIALLFGGLILMERSGGRRVVGLGLVAASIVYFLLDALISIHNNAVVQVWLEFLAVITFTGLLVIRLAPFSGVPRRLRIIPPTQRPLAYWVLAAVTAQFILLFVAIPTAYGSTTIMASSGALGALLPMVTIGGLCAAVALTELEDESQRTFVRVAVMAYFVPELFLMLGSLLLGSQFTYLGNAWFGSGLSVAWFVIAHSIVITGLMTSTLLILKRTAKMSG